MVIFLNDVNDVLITDCYPIVIMYTVNYGGDLCRIMMVIDVTDNLRFYDS